VDALSLEIEDTLSLPILLAWFRANCIKILLGGVVFGLFSIPVTLVIKDTYDSVTTLLVAPPTFKDRDEMTLPRNPAGEPKRSIAELMPRALPVEAYKAIALSGPILAQVINEVPLDIGITALQTRLDVELIKMDGVGITTGMVYTQAIMFRATAHTPELAAKTAQTWAEIFKVQVDEVAANGIKATFTLLETLHLHSKTELEL
jgi:capsular polysaccharide biosynthesis protein